MNMPTEKQLWRDAAVEPTDALIAAGLGAAGGAYLQFIAQLKAHDIQPAWRYYNDGKAWLGKGQYHWVTKRGTQKETTVFWLSVWEGFFRVTIFIPEKHRTQALSLPLDDSTAHMVAQAKQMGKLAFFPLVFDLCSDALLDAVFTLIDFRKNVK